MLVGVKAGIALMVINLVAFGAFWQDKRSAERGLRRTPERDLLGLALIGGSLGAVTAQQLFRHKTRKQPFATYLFGIAAAHAGAVAGWLSLKLG